MTLSQTLPRHICHCHLLCVDQQTAAAGVFALRSPGLSGNCFFKFVDTTFLILLLCGSAGDVSDCFVVFHRSLYISHSTGLVEPRWPVGMRDLPACDLLNLSRWYSVI